MICSNRRYEILKLELARSGITSPAAHAQSLYDLDNPPLDWIHISKGMGVPAVRVDSTEKLTKELKAALNEPGPCLIEMIF